MNIVKLLSLILLAVYLIFSSLADLIGFQFTGMVASLLGAAAVGSGILMLLSIKEFLNLPEEPS